MRGKYHVIRAVDTDRRENYVYQEMERQRKRKKEEKEDNRSQTIWIVVSYLSTTKARLLFIHPVSGCVHVFNLGLSLARFFF